MGAPQVLGHGKAVGLRQHDIQNDDIVDARRAVVDAGLAVVDRVHGVAVVLQDAGQRLGEAHVVFHHQYVHGAPSP